jgi:hypothetical protein
MFDIKLTNLIFKEKLHINRIFFPYIYNIILLNMYLYKKKLV